MEEVTTEEVLNKISQGHLECTICFNRINRPKILDCLHSFCSECLETYKGNQFPNSDKLPCPLCRKETGVPENGIEGLLDNFALTALVEEITIQEALVKRQKSRIGCENCEDDEAVSRCANCKEYLCSECEKAHRRAVKTKRHEIVTMDDLRSGKASFKSKLRDKVPKCKKHANYEVSFFCKSCQVLICAICTALDHSKPEHDYENIEPAEMTSREEVKVLLSEAQKRTEVFVSGKTFIDNASSRRESMLHDALDGISEQANKMVASIRANEDALKSEAHKLVEQRGNMLKSAHESYSENLRWAQDTLEMAEGVLDQLSRYELLDLKKKLVHNLQDINEQHVPSLGHGLPHFLGFKPGPVEALSLGKLLVEEEWSLKVTIRSNPKSDFKRVIGTLTNGDIVIGDFDKKTVSIFNPLGKFQGYLDSPSDQPSGKLQNPYDLAVTQDDKLIIIDGPEVKVFQATTSEDIRFLYSFIPIASRDEGYQPMKDLSCIAVDDKYRIAVGDVEQKIISLHEIDGTLINTVPAEAIGRCLAISNKGHLIFSNYKGAKLVSMDFAGKEVFSVDTIIEGKRLKPSGVSCNHFGDIYLTFHASDKIWSGEVHRYSADGMHMARIIDKLRNPLGLVFTPKGELAIAEKVSVKIYERV